MPEKKEHGWLYKNLVGLLATVLLPAAVAYSTHIYSVERSKEEIRLKYIEMSVDILKQPVTKSSKPIRDWAVDVVNDVCSVKMSPQAKDAVVQEVPLLPRADVAKELEMEGWARLLQGDLAGAQTAFQRADAAYPTFHSAWEMSQLISKKRASGESISEAQKSIYQAALQTYSWRLAPEVRTRMESVLSPPSRRPPGPSVSPGISRTPTTYDAKDPDLGRTLEP